MAQKRSVHMDVLRCFALFCVVAVHSLLYMNFYAVPVTGIRMFWMVSLRGFWMICIGLFLMLSGYLQCHKKPERSYFVKIIRILVIYAMAGCMCMAWKHVNGIQRYTPTSALKALVSLATIPYDWYVEMYVGLFFLMPFLNAGYHALGTQRKKLLLLGVMLLLTVLPNATNIFVVAGAYWWIHPSSWPAYDLLLPDYWTMLYPIMFYFWGCYLREYGLPFRLRWTAVLNVVVFVIKGAFTYYRCDGVEFIEGPWTGYNSLLTVVQAVLVFDLIARFPFRQPGPRTARLLAKLSEWTFGGYLTSYVVDREIYGWLEKKIGTLQGRFEYIWITIPLTFVLSLMISGVLNGIYALGASAVSRLKRK